MSWTSTRSPGRTASIGRVPSIVWAGVPAAKQEWLALPTNRLVTTWGSDCGVYPSGTSSMIVGFSAVAVWLKA